MPTSEAAKREFDRLVRTHRPEILLRVSSRICNPRICAEDIVQDGLISAWTHFDRFDRRRSFVLWTSHICLHLYHHEARDGCSDVNRTCSLEHPRAAAYLSTADPALEVVARLAIEQAIGQLGPVQRRCAASAYAIAMLGIPAEVQPRSTRTNIERARARVLQALAA